MVTDETPASPIASAPKMCTRDVSVFYGDKKAVDGVSIRIREGETGMGKYRQAFFRLGRPILEVVEAADMGEGEPPRFWGITFTTADIDAAAKLLGDKLGRVKDAVQPGRRIATVRKEAGLGLPVALISPRPPR